MMNRTINLSYALILMPCMNLPITHSYANKDSNIRNALPKEIALVFAKDFYKKEEKKTSFAERFQGCKDV